MSTAIPEHANLARTILVASDGTPAAIGALRLARSLAGRDDLTPEVIAVVEPPPVSESAVGELFGVSRSALTQESVEATRRLVQAQLSDVGLDAATVRITVAVGTPAPEIAERARSCGASLILLGLGRHSLYDRVLGTETALKVMALSTVPVLAVPPSADRLPESAVVAVDFTDFSRDAAITAAGLLPAGGTLHLAHVVWSPNPDTQLLAGAEWADAYHARLQRQLNELEREIAAIAELRIRTHLLAGSVPGELLRLAYRERVDLVASGSHGVSFIGRFLMGSVSTRLVRGASCAVLVAPPRGAPVKDSPARSLGLTAEILTPATAA